jgi:predicted small metal-binding protein
MAQKRVSCDCGTVIQGASDGELIERVQQHARSVHQMELSPEQVLSMAEPVGGQ